MTEQDEFDVSVEDGGYFAIIPEWVVYEAISDRAVRLYAVLRRHANTRLMSRPTRVTLADKMRTSLSSIDRALRELEAVGAVTIRHRWTDARGNYVFVKDAEHQTPAPSAYLLHNTPAVVKTKGGRVTRDYTPLVTSEHTVASPVTTPLSSPVEGGVSSPVTDEPEPVEPEKRSLSSAKPTKKKTTELPPRADVEALCTRLRDRIVANGSKATVTAQWRNEARLLVDRDGRDIEKALNLIDWCQADPFWRTNILSMSKFRKQYDQLRLKAIEEHNRRAVDPPAKGDRLWQE